MTLVVAGYWHSTYWPEDHWQQDYWQEYGLVTSKFLLMALSQEFPLNISLSTINALNLPLSQETI